MDTIFNYVCILVTTAFVLTLVPGFRRLDCSFLSRRDQGTALLVFLFLGLVEETAVSHAGLFNERIVAVCAAGLVAGPWVGVAVSLFVTWLAVAHDGLPLGSIGTSMLVAGLVGGFLFRWRPRLARHPLTGFCLTCGVSLLRDALIFFHVLGAPETPYDFGQPAATVVLQGLGTALILAVVAQARDRDERTRAVASAEVRALQARMNPHFLFNALNALAALATVAPREIPRAAGRLRQFLRASFDQQERALVPMEEELTVVRAYLEIESLRFGSRLQVEETVDQAVTGMLVPPFSLQPLVENAVQHGLQSRSGAGHLQVVIRPVGQTLEMRVSDDGNGVPASQVEKTFFAQGPRVHALALLRRRLQRLFGHAFKLEAQSAVGQGTTVTVRIPLKNEREVAGRSLPLHTVDAGQFVTG